MAKLSDVFWALCISRNMSYNNIWIENISKCVFQFVKFGLPVTHICYSLVLTFRNFLEEIGMWRHATYLEKLIFLVNLARVGHSLPLKIFFFDELHACTSLAFLAEAVEFSCLRFINV